MNFKFTKTKTIISLILGLIIGYFFKYGCFGVCPDNYVLIRIGYHILGFAITFVLVYIIWSLVQKRK